MREQFLGNGGLGRFQIFSGYYVCCVKGIVIALEGIGAVHRSWDEYKTFIKQIAELNLYEDSSMHSRTKTQRSRNSNLESEKQLIQSRKNLVLLLLKARRSEPR